MPWNLLIRDYLNQNKMSPFNYRKWLREANIGKPTGVDARALELAKGYLSDLRWDMSQLVSLLSAWKSEAYEDELREIRDKLKAEIDRHKGDYGL